MLPKSGDIAGRVVNTGITHVLTKMGLMGIQLKIASRAQLHPEFEYKDASNTPPEPSKPVAEQEIVQAAEQQEVTKTEDKPATPGAD